MNLDINKLPKKYNEFNYFEKNENGGCTMYSYGLKSDMVIVCELDDFEIEKDFCIDSKALDMLKILNPINEIIVDKTFVIKSKKGKYVGKLIENSSFNKPKMYFENSFNADFMRLKIASSFCSNSDKRPILTGVNVNSNGDINATDSFVAYRYINKENIGKTCYTITIPKDFVDFISKNVDIKDEITINFNYNTCMIKVDNIMYINNLLVGNYPSLSKVFETKNGANKIKFLVDEFKEKVSIAKNIGANKDMPIYITFENDKFEAYGNNDFSGELENISDYKGFDYRFTISLDYLGDILSYLKDDEKITLHYVGNIKPIFFEENENEFLILPIKRD